MASRLPSAVSPPQDPWPVLVGDIGGTHARFAIAFGTDRPLQHKAHFRNSEHASPEAVIAAYLDSLEGVTPRAASLAVAGPVSGDLFHFSNIAWEIDTAALARRFGFSACRLLNDFAALALSVPILGDEEILAFGPGAALPGTPVAVIGPGTGLGVALLVPSLTATPGWQVIPAEGGHVDFAPVTDLEAALLHHLRPRFEGRVSAENLLCGDGIALLHAALAEIAGKMPDRRSTPEIIAEVTGETPDKVCLATLDLYLGMLGSFAGNVALIAGARGGVALGGGILPRLRDRLVAGPFRQRFSAKGQMADYAAAIPTSLILDSDAALHGAAAFLESTLRLPG